MLTLKVALTLRSLSLHPKRVMSKKNSRLRRLRQLKTLNLQVISGKRVTIFRRCKPCLANLSKEVNITLPISLATSTISAMIKFPCLKVDN